MVAREALEWDLQNQLGSGCDRESSAVYGVLGRRNRTWSSNTSHSSWWQGHHQCRDHISARWSECSGGFERTCFAGGLLLPRKGVRSHRNTSGNRWTEYWWPRLTEYSWSWGSLNRKCGSREVSEGRCNCEGTGHTGDPTQGDLGTKQ